MTFQKYLLCLLALTSFSFTAHAQTNVSADTSVVASADSDDNAMDELDPFAPNVEETLKNYDKKYEEETGLSSHIGNKIEDLLTFSASSCYRKSCAVYALVVRSRQMMYLYENGSLQGSWPTSTGIPGRDTPDFDTHPDGRIYDHYTSSKYPGGDYKDLGNMPYAVFIEGGFAIHGTGTGNWPKLGHVASHGCIRIHPDHALVFNRMVRKAGISNTWITVEE